MECKQPSRVTCDRLFWQAVSGANSRLHFCVYVCCVAVARLLEYIGTGEYMVLKTSSASVSAQTDRTVITTMQQSRRNSLRFIMVCYRSSDTTYPRLKGHSQTNSLNDTFMCLWNDVHGLHCSNLFCENDLSAHLWHAHDVRGAGKKCVYYLWKGCNSEMNRESLLRYVVEKHLDIAHSCGSRFRRRHLE